jgi:PAS domain S-box-containing protein
MPNASKLSADSGLVRYGSAVAAIALATVLQLLLQPVLGNSAPFAMSVIAVAVVARYGGLGPAIVALALGAVAVAYFILPPRGTFEVRGLENQIKLAMYVFVGAVIAFLSESMRQARQRVEASVHEARRTELRRVARLAVTQVLAQARSVGEAAPRILQAVCKSLGWQAGALWTLDREASCLRCLECWHAASLPLEELKTACLGVSFEQGVGLPGRIWSSGKPAWIPDVASDTNFPRAAVAMRVGVRGAYGWPILQGTEVVGVIEFFSSEIREPDADLLEMMATVGSQIGQFLQRTEANEAVRQSEERLRLALEAGHMGTWEWNIPSGRITWSPGLHAIHGIAPGSFAGTFDAHLSDVHPEDREQVKNSLARTLEAGEKHQIEYRLVWPDRSVHWVEGRGGLFRDANGTPLRMSGICIDITERKRGEQAAQFLAEASATLSTLEDYQSTLQKIAHLAVPFFADWCVVHMIQEDGSLCRVAAAHADPSKAELARELVRRYPQDANAPYGVPNVLRTGRSEIVQRIPDGMLAARAQDEEHLRMLQALALKSYMCVPLAAHGKVLGVLSFIAGESGRCYDAKDLAAAEDLARRATVAIENALLLRQVRDQDRRKDEFLAMLAHELRNPLAPVRNALHILGMQGADAATSQQARDVIKRQIQHMVRLVDDLLDVSRIMRGKIELRKQPVALASVIERSLETMQPILNAHSHELQVSLPEESIWLDADPVRLAQVVANLLSNAAKYSNRQNTIRLTAAREGPDAVVRVRDSGIGIAPEMLGKIFDLFMQADQSIERSQGGLGIGLTLARTLVELHGGTIRAYSEGLGHGSEFVVRLPALTRQPDSQRGGPHSPSAAGTAETSRRLLVVDDNVDGADSLAVVLRMWGHEVRIAHSGPQAVELVKSYQPDIVLLDIGLPGMSGYEVARKIRGLQVLDKPLLVAITGYGQNEDRRRSLEAGFDRHLIKPVEPGDLRQILAQRMPVSSRVHSAENRN